MSAFMLDGNHRSDPATLSDPALANLARFKAALIKAGVAVDATMERGVAAADPVLAQRTSAPLSELVASMLKRSDNTYAETILKEVGAVSGAASTDGGLALVTKQFDRYGIERPVLGDGSGLSSVNRSSAAQQVGWLTKIASSKFGPAFRSGLPVACVDGTLRSRMCGTKGAGNVTAKTGYINNTVALAGYATTAGGRTVVFSMLQSKLPSTAAARVAADKVMALVASYTG